MLGAAASPHASKLPVLGRFCDVDTLQLDHNGDVVGLDTAIAQLRETRPYIFKERVEFDPAQIHQQLEDLGRAEQTDRLARFVASKPGDERLLAAVLTGDLRC